MDSLMVRFMLYYLYASSFIDMSKSLLFERFFFALQHLSISEIKSVWHVGIVRSNRISWFSECMYPFPTITLNLYSLKAHYHKNHPIVADRRHIDWPFSSYNCYYWFDLLFWFMFGLLINFRLSEVFYIKVIIITIWLIEFHT